MEHEELPTEASWKARIAAAVASTPAPRCTTHFLTKFENQSEKTLLSPLFAPSAAGAAGASNAQASNTARVLLVSKKHSGSLLMAPPFYSKNATANRFSRLGCLTMRNYMCAVWGEATAQPAAFTRWWADAEAKGLCYSFELVVPRALGDHGATPLAAYLVLTTVAVTRGPSPRFLSPAEVIALATAWRLPLNEVWYFPAAAAPRVEAALHAARWALKDSQVDALLGHVTSAAIGGHAASGSGAAGAAPGGATNAAAHAGGVKQGFLTHLETQGEVLEGFVLMALEVGDLAGLQQLVAAYNATMQPWHGAALKQALELGARCLQRDPALEAALGDNGGGVPSAGVGLSLERAFAAAAVGLPEAGPWPEGLSGSAPEPRRVPVAAADLWPLVCAAAGDVGGLFRRLCSSYQHRVVLKAYRYTPVAFLAAPLAGAASATDAATPPTAENGGAASEVFQVQVEIHDDEVFYSWPLHARAGGCAPLYRGMVVQFDGHVAPGTGGGNRGLAEDVVAAAGVGAGALEMRILGIAKLKCLNYLWRTFGVRNQLPTLLGNGEAAFVRKCQTVFFKNWAVPPEHRVPMLALLAGWAQFVVSLLSAKEREGLQGRAMYLGLLERYLASGDAAAQQAAHLVSGVGAGRPGASAAAALARGGERSSGGLGSSSSGSNGGGGSSAAAAIAASPLSPPPSLLAPFYTVVANLTGSDLPPGLLCALGLDALRRLDGPPVGIDPPPGCWLECRNTLPSTKQLGDLRLAAGATGDKAASSGGKGGKGGGKGGKGGKTSGGGLVGVGSGGAPRLVLALGPPPRAAKAARVAASRTTPTEEDVRPQGDEGGSSGKVSVKGGGGGSKDPLERERGMLSSLAAAEGKAGSWRSRHVGVHLLVDPHKDLEQFRKDATAAATTTAAAAATAAASAALAALPAAAGTSAAGSAAVLAKPVASCPPLGAPVVVLVCVLALPPGGGKSTLFAALQAGTAGATVVSSDECAKTNKKFDAELKAAIKAAASRQQKKDRGNIGGSTGCNGSSGESFAVVGYDKNIPQATGLAKLLKVLRPLAEGTEKGNPVPMDLRIALVVPDRLDRGVCWQRIRLRDGSYLLNACPPVVQGSMAPGACAKVFEDFYGHAARWLPSAQSLAPNHAVVTPAFFQAAAGGAAAADNGLSACGKVVADLVGSRAHVDRRALPFARLDEAFQRAQDGAADEEEDWGSGEGGGASGAGGPAGRAVWCSAEIARTNLHLTLVPPPGARESEEAAREAALERMRPQHGHKVWLTVTKYHVADFTPPMGLTATKPGSRRGGKGGDVAAPGAKHVGLWEVDAVEGLWPGSALPSQAACYHVTDVGSLGPSTKPSQAYQVLHSVIQPSRTAAHAVAPQALAHAAAANEAVAAVSAFSGEECKACGAEGHKMADCPQAAPAKLNDGSRSSSSNRDRSGGSGSGSSGRSDKPSEASLMRRAIAAGQAAAARGERCSGCVVALDGRVVCEASNGVQAANGDLACTAPVLAVRELTGSGANSGGARVPLVAEHDRARCVVYCSEEPCAMGAGALLWGGVGRVVFAASGAQVQAAEAACRSGGNTLRHSSGSAAAAVSPTLAELLAHAPRPVAVQGGLLAQEALAAMRAATPDAAAAPSAEEVPATGRKRAAEGAPDNSSTTRNDACTVLERDGWTVRTYTFSTPLRIEATIGLRC